MLRRPAIVALLACLMHVHASGQAERLYDSLSVKFQVRDSTLSGSLLYVHTDKTIYTGNENIWFSAYLLKAMDDLNNYHTLHVVLSHRITHEVVASNRFVMRNGLAAGNLFVADSFPPGDYNFIAYTNSINKEGLPGLFQQQVTIRYGGGNPFRVELEAGASSSDSLRFLAHVTNKAMLNATGASFDYTIYGNNKEISKGLSVVSPFGEVPITAPERFSPGKMELAATIKKEKTVFSTRMPLSFLGKEISFRWYPESGNWINGLPTRTAFEVMDRGGKPVAVKGQLLQDGKPVVSFQSSATGIGAIEFIPLAEKEYSLVLDDKERKVISTSFPEVKTKGAIMQVKQAVAKDTLLVKLQSNGAGRKLYLMVHNYRQIFDFLQINMPNASATLKVPMQLVPAGLGTLTLFDSSFHPLAERTFFSGYDSLAAISIIADSLNYHRRSKVDLQISVNDAAGQPLDASISMAVVLTKAVDTTRFQDMLPYQLFSDYIDMGIIPRISMYGIGDRNDLEMTLLLRCWTRYNDPVPDSSVRLLAAGKELNISGTVKTDSRRLKNKPVEVTVLAGAGLNVVTTDPSGHFVLPPEMTAVKSHEKVSLIVNDKNKEEYSIEFDHEVDSLNSKLAGLDYPEAKGIKAIMPWTDEVLTQVKTLSAVVVKSKANSWGSEQGQPFMSPTCNDYVCSYNILNCPNHRTGSPAVEGQVYNYRGTAVVYHCPGRNEYGDKEILFKIKGRYYSKEFYVADYAKFNPPDPEKYSTVFWSQQIVIRDGKADVSFYTNDLAGVFSIIIQGISTRGPVWGHQQITVTE